MDLAAEARSMGCGFGKGRRFRRWEGSRSRRVVEADSGKDTGMDTQWRVWNSGLAASL